MGAPAMGAEGVGMGNVISRIYQAVVLGAVILRNEPELAHVSWRPDFAR